MANLVYEKIDNHVILYIKRNIKDYDNIVTPNMLSNRLVNIIFNNDYEDSFIKENVKIHIMDTPMIEILYHQMRIDQIMFYFQKEVLDKKLDNVQIIFHVPRNHPLRNYEITKIKKLINQYKHYLFINKLFDDLDKPLNAIKHAIRIKIITDSKDIVFGSKHNSSKVIASFKNNTLEITRTYASDANTFIYPTDYFVNNINDDNKLISYFKNTTPAAILKSFKSDKEMLDFFREDYYNNLKKKNEPEKIKINLQSNGKDIDQIKKNVEKTIKESFGIKEESNV